MILAPPEKEVGPRCLSVSERRRRVSTGGVKPLDRKRLGEITVATALTVLPLLKILDLFSTCLSEVLIVAESSRTMAIVG